MEQFKNQESEYKGPCSLLLTLRHDCPIFHHATEQYACPNSKATALYLCFKQAQFEQELSETLGRFPGRKRKLQTLLLLCLNVYIISSVLQKHSPFG